MFTLDSNWKLLLLLLALVLLWFLMGGYLAPTAQYGQLIENPAKIGGSSGVDTTNSYGYTGYAARNLGGALDSVSTAPLSSYTNSFSLSAGSAAYEYRPNNEYITLRYWGEAPVDITGWYLTNSNGSKLYEQNSRLFSGATGSGVIPTVTNLLVEGAKSLPQTNLILRDGDEVVITTGSPPASSRQFSAAAKGFRVNRCVGYLTEDYNFTPNLYGSCPAPREWSAVNGLDDECYEFVTERIGSCRVPEFRRNWEGERTIDGAPDALTSRCRAFIQEQFNYNSCVANFGGQNDFYQPEWRVFLNLSRELWADRREVISLYDRYGRLVTQTSY